MSVGIYSYYVPSWSWSFHLWRWWSSSSSTSSRAWWWWSSSHDHGDPHLHDDDDPQHHHQHTLHDDNPQDHDDDDPHLHGGFWADSASSHLRAAGTSRPQCPTDARRGKNLTFPPQLFSHFLHLFWLPFTLFWTHFDPFFIWLWLLCDGVTPVPSHSQGEKQLCFYGEILSIFWGSLLDSFPFSGSFFAVWNFCLFPVQCCPIAKEKGEALLFWNNFFPSSSIFWPSPIWSSLTAPLFYLPLVAGWLLCDQLCL